MLEHEVIGRGAGHLPRTDQIVADNRLEPLVGDVAGSGNILAAGIVHKHVEPAVVLFDLQHCRFDALLVSGIAWHDEGFAAQGADHLGGLLKRLLTTGEKGQSGPAGCHFKRAGAAHTGARAGHESHLSCHEVGGVTALHQFL